MSKTVIDGKIQHLSVTAIHMYSPKEFGGCPRRWWFRYVAGLPEAPQLSQITGTKIHKDIEDYLLKGTPILNETVKAGAHYLPTPKSVEVEKPFNGILTAAGIPMKGFIDVYNKSPVYIDSLGNVRVQDPGDLEVVDWKSTSDLKYAKAGQDLKTTQMVGYAKFASLVEPDLKRVRLSHVYFRTKGRAEAVKNSVIITLDEIDQRYQDTERTAELIKQTALATRVEDVEPNRVSCTAYRGCPFVEQCPKSGVGGVSTMATETMIEKMKRLKAEREANQIVGTNTANPKATPQPSPAGEHKIPAPVEAAEVEALEADYNNVGRVLGMCPKCTKQVTADTGSKTPSGNIVHLSGCSGIAINPPDAAKPALTPPTKPEPTPAPVVTNPAGEHKIPAIASPAPVKDEPKTRAKRTPKAEPAPGDVAEAKEREQALTGEPSGFDLLVNVRRVKGRGLVPLEPIIEEAMAELAKESGISDVRLAEGQHPMAFGKWKVYLAMTLVALAKDGKIRGTYSLSDVTESDVKTVALEALTPLAGTVIRGY